MAHLGVGLLMIFAKERLNCPPIHLLKDAELLEEEEAAATTSRCARWRPVVATRKRRRRKRDSTSLRCNIGVSEPQGATSVRLQYLSTIPDILM